MVIDFNLSRRHGACWHHMTEAVPRSLALRTVELAAAVRSLATSRSSLHRSWPTGDGADSITTADAAMAPMVGGPISSPPAAFIRRIPGVHELRLCSVARGGSEGNVSPAELVRFNPGHRPGSFLSSTVGRVLERPSVFRMAATGLLVETVFDESAGRDCPRPLMVLSGSARPVGVAGDDIPIAFQTVMTMSTS